MKTPAKLKPSEMSAEVRSMIDLRHQAEQRGHFEPLGRLLSIDTAHGTIEFEIQQGQAAGPDLARAVPTGYQISEIYPEEGKVTQPVADLNTLLVLGAWAGLPALRRNSAVPCPKCKHICEVCRGTGKKQCEGLDCGGRGYTLGKWASCPGPGCHKETGNYKADCATCAGSDVRGMMRELVDCLMCKGTGMMTCSACRGTKKRSTGRVNGSLDWRLPACKACGGTGLKGEMVAQPLEKFTNAELQTYKHNPKYLSGVHGPGCGKGQILLALGPIHSFSLKDFTTAKLRTFEVSPDALGDYLMLLVPKVLRGSRSKAYLVGGVVREVGSGERVA
jgi:hypothetical protein